MNRLQQLLNFKTISAAFVLLLVLAAATLYINQGFYFAYYHPTFVIEVRTESGDASQILDDYALRSNVSRVDREAGTLSLQDVNEAEARALATEIMERDDVRTTGVSVEQLVLPTGIQSRLIMGIGIAVLLSFSYFYYVFGRRFAKQNLRTTYLAGFFVALAIYSVMFIQAGILSAVSRLYVLTEASFIGILIVFMWGITVAMLSLREAFGKPGLVSIPSLSTILENLQLNVLEGSAKAFMLWSFILLGLVFGLGTNFAVDAILIAAGLALVQLGMAVLPRFYHYLFAGAFSFRLGNKRVGKKKLVGKKSTKKSKKKAEPEVVKEVTSSKPSKSELKKKSTKKSKRRNRK